eukprot:g5766.t1 g5766   contig20:122792-124868(+)
MMPSCSSAEPPPLRPLHLDCSCCGCSDDVDDVSSSLVQPQNLSALTSSNMIDTVGRPTTMALNGAWIDDGNDNLSSTSRIFRAAAAAVDMDSCSGEQDGVGVRRGRCRLRMRRRSSALLLTLPSASNNGAPTTAYAAASVRAVPLMMVAALLLCSAAVIEAFAPPSLLLLHHRHPPIAITTTHQFTHRPPQLLLQAVHKRSGNHDLTTSSRAKIAAAEKLESVAKQQQQQNGKRPRGRPPKNKQAAATVVVGGGGSGGAVAVKAAAASKPAASTSATQPQHQRVISPNRQTTPKRHRKSNVFEQFTPEYTKSPFDVDLSGDEEHNGGIILGGKNNRRNSNEQQAANTTANKSGSKLLSQRLQSLLQNDEGEQDPYLADDSPEAACQLADIGVYGKLSESARRKAVEAVKDRGSGSGGVDKEGGVVNGAKRRGRIVVTTESSSLQSSSSSSSSPQPSSLLQPRKRRTVRATVKETGSDSISTYIKSLGQHELLYKEDEVLLGRQVRLLMGLEGKRRDLEEELLRPPTFAQWASATNHTVPSLKQQIRRSQRAKAALIEANLRLVITVARQAVKKSPSDQAVTLHPRSNSKMPANKASLASLALLKSLTRSWDFASPRMPYGGFKRKLPRMSMSSRGRFAFLEVQSKRLMIFVFKNECS